MNGDHQSYWDDAQIGGDKYFASVFQTQVSRHHTGAGDSTRKESCAGGQPIGRALLQGYEMISDDEVLSGGQQERIGQHLWTQQPQSDRRQAPWTPRPL